MELTTAQQILFEATNDNLKECGAAPIGEELFAQQKWLHLQKECLAAMERYAKLKWEEACNKQMASFFAAMTTNALTDPDGAAPLVFKAMIEQQREKPFPAPDFKP